MVSRFARFFTDGLPFAVKCNPVIAVCAAWRIAIGKGIERPVKNRQWLRILGNRQSMIMHVVIETEDLRSF